jgi:ketosteroid isomerase-like protein
MNRQKAYELVNAYVEGWKNDDPAQIVDTLASDCVVVESHGPTYRGLEIAARWIESWLGAGNTVDRWDVTSLCFDEVEQTAAFEWVFECMADGVRYEIDGISIVEFAGDKIVALREYRVTAPPYEWTDGF